MATARAIAEIRSVPVKTGMAPKEPPAVTWPSRMGICGSQLRPKKNSSGETRSKKRKASNRSESTMPSVVRMAISEQAIITPLSTRSVAWRARNSGLMRALAIKRPSRATLKAATTIA